MNEQNRQRELIQKKAVRLSEENKHILLSWATGSGKTLAALRCIEELKTKKQWLLLIKETNHENNWRQEIEKYGLTEWFNETFVDVICYASAHKYRDSSYNLLCDEVHALSELREDHLNTIAFDHIISLSATVPSEVKQRLSNLCPFHEYHISLQEAIDTGLLPEPEVRIVPVQMDDKIRSFTYKIKTKEFKATQKGYYDYLDNQVAYWKNRFDTERQDWQKDMWMREALKRKRWIAEQKTDAAKALVKTLGNERFICFTGSVAQANKLGGKYAVHSKNKNNQALIDDFNELRSDKLFAVGMLREAMNLNNISSAVIVQMDNNEKSTTQIAGRSLRSIAPKLYIMVLRGTMDDKYLTKALSLFKPEYIKLAP